jgi:NDP-sugar pyrophosphorylase family protein
MIRSAILLAAGRGKRQRPYTDDTPKPLLPVHGRPTLDFVLTAVKHARVERVCLVTNHLEDKIIEYVGDGSRWKLNVAFAHQEHLDGTAGALMSVPGGWTDDEPFMAIATDYILGENSLSELVAVHERNHADITMSLKRCPIEDLVARSSVEIDAVWRVRRIIEKPLPQEILSPYAASFLFIFPRQLWTYLAKVRQSPRGEIETQAAVQMMIKDGFKACGVVQPAPEEWDAARHLTPDDQGRRPDATR